MLFFSFIGWIMASYQSNNFNSRHSVAGSLQKAVGIWNFYSHSVGGNTSILVWHFLEKETETVHSNVRYASPFIATMCQSFNLSLSTFCIYAMLFENDSCGLIFVQMLIPLQTPIQTWDYKHVCICLNYLFVLAIICTNLIHPHGNGPNTCDIRRAYHLIAPVAKLLMDCVSYTRLHLAHNKISYCLLVSYSTTTTLYVPYTQCLC